MNPTAPARLLELLADRALEGLSSTEEAELVKLLEEHPGLDPRSLDLAAAMLAAVESEDTVESLPAELRRKIEEQAQTMLPIPGKTAAPPTMPRPPAEPARPLRSWVLPWAGWAIAAGLLISVSLVWWTNRTPTTAQKFARFLAETGDLVHAQGGAPDPKARPEITGEIYWSAAQQHGFMKLHGLSVNDPHQAQYQLWIFDKKRDDRYPVDGGVFDINKTGEVLIPVETRVRVRDATLFVVTREPPGGVVVSDRKQIVLVASIK